MTPKVHLGTLFSGARTAGGKAAAATSRLAGLFYRHIYVIEHLCYNPPNVKSPEAGGGPRKPHNLDLKVSDPRLAYWSVKQPVENQRPKALREGVAVPVAKEPSLAEQKERERLSKPPPAETPGQDQKEAVPDDQRKNKKKYEHPVHPSKTDPDWKSYSKRERKKLDEEWFFDTIVEGIQYDNEARNQELEELGYVSYPPREEKD